MTGSIRNSADGEGMSYYIDHIIECDKLAYERMFKTWQQKGWDYKCVLRRPRIVWFSEYGSVQDVKAETYLLYFIVNHSPSAEDVFDWLCEDLGVYDTHFSIWSKGECDEKWRIEGTFVQDYSLPHHTVPAEYDKESENHRKAPEGYTTYEDFLIAVDTSVWREIAVDYTRDDDVLPMSPIEELLQNIDGKLGSIEEMLERLADGAKNELYRLSCRGFGW